MGLALGWLPEAGLHSGWGGLGQRLGFNLLWVVTSKMQEPGAKALGWERGKPGSVPPLATIWASLMSLISFVPFLNVHHKEGDLEARCVARVCLGVACRVFQLWFLSKQGSDLLSLRQTKSPDATTPFSMANPLDMEHKDHPVPPLPLAWPPLATPLPHSFCWSSPPPHRFWSDLPTLSCSADTWACFSLKYLLICPP